MNALMQHVAAMDEVVTRVSRRLAEARADVQHMSAIIEMHCGKWASDDAGDPRLAVLSNCASLLAHGHILIGHAATMIEQAKHTPVTLETKELLMNNATECIGMLISQMANPQFAYALRFGGVSVDVALHDVIKILNLMKRQILMLLEVGGGWAPLLQSRVDDLMPRLNKANLVISDCVRI